MCSTYACSTETHRERQQIYDTSFKKYYNTRIRFLTWQKGLYYHLHKTGKTIRKHPDGKDPLKQKLLARPVFVQSVEKEKALYNFTGKQITDIKIK